MKRKVSGPGLTPQCSGVQMEACTWLPEPPIWNSGSLAEKRATVMVIMDSCSSVSWTTLWMVSWITKSLVHEAKRNATSLQGLQAPGMQRRW